jgi:hypothetical protein
MKPRGYEIVWAYKNRVGIKTAWARPTLQFLCLRIQ